MTRSWLLAPTAALLLLTACDNGTAEPLRPDAGPPPVVTAEVTYYEHVRPILVETCVMCHTTAGIAPFSLETYEDAREVGERMREVTRDRIMPPFLADSSGECNTWSNHRGLTDEEIDTIDQWVQQGRLEGDPSIVAPEPTPLPALPSVDLTIEMQQTYEVRLEEDDDYRCFIHDPEITEDTFVTGYDVHPGNTQRVHHVIVYNPVDEGQEAAAYTLDAENGTPTDGYPCFGGPRVDAVPIVLWAPGAGATTFPVGTGVQLEAGRAQIIQVHYNNLVDDAPETDLTTIDLSTADSVSPAYIVPFADFNLNLPPRQSEVVESYTQSLSFLPIPVRIMGAFPHMHTLGRSLRVDLVTSDGDDCLINIERWDFNWQLAYWLDRPMRVSPDDSARITCTFDTTERDEMVHWGDGTQDEMCLSFVYATL